MALATAVYSVVSSAELITLKLLSQNKHTLTHPWERIVLITHINKDHLIPGVSARKYKATVNLKCHCSIVSQFGKKNKFLLFRSHFSVFVRRRINQYLKPVNRAP